MASWPLRAGAQTARWTGTASALAAVILIAALALATTGGVTPWLMTGGAVLLGGMSVIVNGLIGREMAQRKELQRDLRAAAAIQRSLLPDTLPEIAGCEFAMSCRMSREIGGDCVEALTLRDGRVALLVGDVSGKGIAAALVMSGVQAQFRTLAEMGFGLPDVAARIEQQLLDRSNGRYVTAVLIILDAATGTFEYLSAGHVPFVHLDPAGDPVAISSTGPPLGLLPGPAREVHRRSLPKGAALILVTDGVTERRQGDSDYGVNGLLAVAPRMRGMPAQQAVDALLADNDQFAGGIAADDDLTVVVLRATS